MIALLWSNESTWSGFSWGTGWSLVKYVRVEWLEMGVFVICLHHQSNHDSYYFLFVITIIVDHCHLQRPPHPTTHTPHLPLPLASFICGRATEASSVILSHLNRQIYLMLCALMMKLAIKHHPRLLILHRWQAMKTPDLEVSVAKTLSEMSKSNVSSHSSRGQWEQIDLGKFDGVATSLPLFSIFYQDWNQNGKLTGFLFYLSNQPINLVWFWSNF